MVQVPAADIGPSKAITEPSLVTIKPASGRLRNAMLCWFLRCFVKRQNRNGADVEKLRGNLAKLERSAAKSVGADLQRIEVVCNDVPAQWLYPPGSRDDRVLLYIHGGAFVAYTPEVYSAMVASWCRPLSARALMINYRLAPEHPYPAPLIDCIRAYSWLLNQGVDPQNIVVAGDSAGGNLALALLQHLAHENLPMPRCSILISPFLDFTLTGKSALSNARKDPIFTPEFAINIRGFYAPGELYSSPAVSPLFGSFDGLSPMLIQVGSSEMLLDDAVRASEYAAAAGVPVQLEVWDQLPHVFQMVPALPQAQQAAERIRDFIRTQALWA